MNSDLFLGVLADSKVNFLYARMCYRVGVQHSHTVYIQ